MRRLGFTLIAVLAVVTAFGAAQDGRLPKPQIASAQGQPAPDFVLQNQLGNEFRLSALRGTQVLLIFYRGYW